MVILKIIVIWCLLALLVAYLWSRAYPKDEDQIEPQHSPTCKGEWGAIWDQSLKRKVVVCKCGIQAEHQA